MVAVAGVVELRAVGDQAEDVALSRHLDVAPGGGNPIRKFQAAVQGDGNIHEKVDIGNEVPDAHRDGGLAESEQKAVPAVVHELLVQAVTHGVALRAAPAPETVVTAAGVGGDGEKGPAPVGEKNAACCEIDIALRPEGLIGTVAFRDIVGVVEQGIHSLIALEIRDAEGLAFLDPVEPWVTGLQFATGRESAV